MKKIIILLVIVVVRVPLFFAQGAKKYSAEEIKHDLDYMYRNLEMASYDLFAYVPKEEMDDMYKKIRGSIKEPLTALETFRQFQPLVASAKISHCFMYNPWNHYLKSYLKGGGTVFPLNLHLSQEKVTVKDNFSGNRLIGELDEILSFNEKPIDQFMKEFYKFLSGPSDYYKNSAIEQNLFPRLYWFFYGECQEFKLRIKKPDGREQDIQVQAIPGNEFEKRVKQRKSEKKAEREFQILNGHTAYLRPGEFININSNFDMSDSKTWNNTEFCNFIDSAFTKFRKSKIKNLVIDLRNNNGGDNSFSDYMIAYFADKPFGISSKFSIKTSEMTKNFWRKLEDAPEHETIKKQILSHENGTCFDVDMPVTKPHKEPKRFHGNVYVLINRYTYSNAASVAAIIQDYQFGIIIGEETAEEVSSQGSLHIFKLPHTQWPVAYPKSFGIRPNGDASPRGVVPDHVVYDDVSTPEDEMLDFALKLIREKQ